MSPTILTAAHALLPDGWARDVRLTMEDGWIAHVETDVTGLAPPDVVLLPSLTNAHAHSPARAMAGLAETSPGREGDVEWGLHAEALLRHATPEQIGDVVRYAHVEMLEGGFTSVVEALHLHAAPSGTPYDDPGVIGAAVMRAAEEAGTALTLIPCSQGTDPAAAKSRGATTPERFLRITRRLVDLASDTPHAVGFGLAGPMSLPEGAVRDALTEFKDGPVQVVVAERARDALSHLSATKARAVTWLCETYSVDARWSFVGANHLVDAEVQAMARARVTGVALPSASLASGAGIFPATRLMAASGRLAIGTGNAAHADAATEMRLLEHGQRLRDRRRGAAWRGATGRALFDQASRSGAGIAGHRTGRLGVGYRADMMTLDLADDALALRRDNGWLDAFVFAAGRRALRDVWVNGIRQVEGGVHVKRDAAKAAYLGTLKTLMASA